MTRSTIGEIRGHAESRRLLETAIREIWHLGRQRGIALSDDAVERSMAFIDQLPAETTASMQRDWMADRPSELDAQSGAVLRLAEESGVEVPVNAFLHAALILRRNPQPAGGRSLSAAFSREVEVLDSAVSAQCRLLIGLRKKFDGLAGRGLRHSKNRKYKKMASTIPKKMDLCLRSSSAFAP